MNVLRIILTQNCANYKKEETVINKMTYPLPPFSTIIGALHFACNYSRYHHMDISIQGIYGSMHKRQYTDNAFLKNIQDDRGMLVKMKNPDMLSTAFDKVAVAAKSQGNSFQKGISINVINEELVKEYRDLKEMPAKIKDIKNNRIDPIVNKIKNRLSRLKEKKTACKRNTAEFKRITNRERELRELKKSVIEWLKNYEIENYVIPFSRFATLNTSPRYYEVLNDVKLIIHLRSDDNTLEDIKNNICNLKSIGRSEDFVDVKDICYVELKENPDEGEIVSNYSGYLDYNLIKDDIVILRGTGGAEANGTKYYLNKNYTVVDGKRVFKKKKVVYASRYTADRGAPNLLFDIGDKETFIVNFN